jgi:hypothetical protein
MAEFQAFPSLEVPPLAGLRGKSIGGKIILAGDPPVLPQAGPSGIANSECALNHVRFRAALHFI